VIAVELRLARSNVPAGAREEAIERVRRAIATAVPGGVTSVAAIVPFHGAGYFWAVESPGGGSPQQDRMVLVDSITPPHFGVLGATRLSGRGFEDRDVAGAGSIGIVNRTFARRFLGGEARIPQRLRFDAGRDVREIEIVGVVEDVPYENVVNTPAAVLYLPRAQHVYDDGRAYVVVRPPVGAVVSGAAIRSAVATADAGLSYQVVSLSESGRDQYARARALAIVAVLFVVVAVLIAGLGVFGVMSHAVTERRRELGVRVALGALPRQVAGLVMRRAALLTIAGAAVGLTAAWWIARLTTSLLIATDVHDGRVFVGAATTMIVTGVLAAWWPARRAARTDPAAVLRCE
jgi:putative ABC transport system permease protein